MPAQAYGAGDYLALGEVLQRALLVCWAACVPVGLLWLLSDRVMVALGQDPKISAMAGRWVCSHIYPPETLVGGVNRRKGRICEEEGEEREENFLL
jgi:MATE family multidrug resistance protein